MRAVFLPTERLIMKGSAQPSASTANSSSRNEISGSASGLLKPKVVVSQEGLNFIQDQKDFAERKKTTPKDTSANILRIALFSMAQQKIEENKAVTTKKLFPAEVKSIPKTTGTLLKREITSPESKSPAKVSWAALLAGKQSQPLKAPETVLTLQNLPDLKEEPDSPTSPSSPMRKMLRSARRIPTATSLSQGSSCDKIRVSDKVKSRLISLFQSKKSTVEPQPKPTKFLQFKHSVRSTLDAEKQSAAPSPYITKRVRELSKLVTREERETQIRHKLQQVLSGDHAPSEINPPSSFVMPKKILSDDCVKENLLLQKIMRLQHLRNVRLNEDSKPKRMPAEDKFDSCADVADLNAEFIQIMEGVKSTKKQIRSPALSFCNSKEDLANKEGNISGNLAVKKYPSIRVTTRSTDH